MGFHKYRLKLYTSVHCATKLTLINFDTLRNNMIMYLRRDNNTLSVYMMICDLNVNAFARQINTYEAKYFSLDFIFISLNLNKGDRICFLNQKLLLPELPLKEVTKVSNL